MCICRSFFKLPFWLFTDLTFCSSLLLPFAVPSRCIFNPNSASFGCFFIFFSQLNLQAYFLCHLKPSYCFLFFNRIAMVRTLTVYVSIHPRLTPDMLSLFLSLFLSPSNYSTQTHLVTWKSALELCFSCSSMDLQLSADLLAWRPSGITTDDCKSTIRPYCHVKSALDSCGNCGLREFNASADLFQSSHSIRSYSAVFGASFEDHSICHQIVWQSFREIKDRFSGLNFWLPYHVNLNMIDHCFTLHV